MNVSLDILLFFFCYLTDPVISLATSSRTVLIPFQRSSGVSSSCAAFDAVNLLVTSAANCTAFSSLSSSRFRGGMLCCLSFSQPDFQSHHEQLMICASLLLDTCDNSSRFFSIFAQLRCSLSDSGCCHQERSRYTAALDVVWTWYWSEPTRAPSRSLLAAHRLHMFLLSHTAQPRMTLQTVLFCRLEVAHYEQHIPLGDLFNCLRQVLVEQLHFFLCGCCVWSIHLET